MNFGEGTKIHFNEKIASIQRNTLNFEEEVTVATQFSLDYICSGFQQIHQKAKDDFI